MARKLLGRDGQVSGKLRSSFFLYIYIEWSVARAATRPENETHSVSLFLTLSSGSCGLVARKDRSIISGLTTTITVTSAWFPAATSGGVASGTVKDIGLPSACGGVRNYTPESALNYTFGKNVVHVYMRSRPTRGFFFRGFYCRSTGQTRESNSQRIENQSAPFEGFRNSLRS